MQEKKQIAVLTDFMNFPSQYGLVPVVLGQLRMLLKHGWEPHLYVVEGTEFEKDVIKVPEGVVVEPHVPWFHLFDYQLGTKEQIEDISPIGEHGPPAKTNLKKQIDLAYKYLEPELSKFKIVIEHDIIYQTWKIPYNAALRRVANNHKDIKWLHWCHSAPSPRPDVIEYPHNLRFMPMNNSIWVTFNDLMRQGFAVQYGVPIDRVKTVYHFIDDVAFHMWSDTTQRLIYENNLLEADVLCVYPVRFDHYEAKGVPQLIKLMAYMNRFGNAKLVFLNSWSAQRGGIVSKLRKDAEALYMPPENLVFSSELGPEFRNGVPRRVVSEMFGVSNMFAMPSQSETFSLVLGEAMQKKNYIVYNSDLEPLLEIHGKLGYGFPWGKDWGGVLTTRKYEPSEERFYLDRAKEIYENIKNNQVLASFKRGMQTFNIDWIYKNQLEPLLR